TASDAPGCGRPPRPSIYRTGSPPALQVRDDSPRCAAGRPAHVRMLRKTVCPQRLRTTQTLDSAKRRLREVVSELGLEQLPRLKQVGLDGVDRDTHQKGDLQVL